MNVSVIIPVYNAERFIVSAVESALAQSETAEVILIEDNSPDNALEVCKGLEERHAKVRLLRHEGGVNRGAGESRNLGIRNARYEYIAFLDADDYYLENRFAKAAQILSEDKSVDGVYEAVGSEFENEESERRYYATHVSAIATVDNGINPEELFHYLVAGNAGYIHLNGLVVKKTGLEAVGLLPELRLHQDMVLCVKLAAMLKLVGGETTAPIAIRRLHLENRITDVSTDFSVTRFAAYEDLLGWCQSHVVRDKQQLIRNVYWGLGYRVNKNARKYPKALYYYLLRRLLGS